LQTTNLKSQIAFDEAFPHDYRVEIVPVPTQKSSLVQLEAEESKPIYFPQEIEPEIERVSAVAVSVKPANAPEWTGVFAKAFDSGYVANGLFACPDPRQLCVVAGGYAYLVNTADPKHWERIASNPVTDVRVIAPRGLLVFADFVTLAAYGRHGRVWQTGRLSWDGLRIVHVADDEIRGVGWDLRRDKEVEFVVDVATGAHRGGAAP
jgi:hypothetical protein